MSKDLIKRLSHSSEQSIRDDAIDELHQQIKDDKLEFTDVSMRMVFQGLFYCFYHSDKSPYQRDLADKITGFMDNISSEENKLMWHRHFFRMLSLHWDKLDGWRINKYLMLIRKQLIVVFKHIQTIWTTQPANLQKYMDALYDESLKEAGVPMGIGLQMADIYIDEVANNFKKEELLQDRVSALLSPFLQAIGTTHQIALFMRIKEKVFEKLIDCNGIKADETNELYFPRFDIVEYSEKKMFVVASSSDTIESRRDDIYKLYERAAGKEKPKPAELPYADRLKALQRLHKPKTKHQKKAFIREKASKAMKIKKRILKMMHGKQLQMAPGIGGDLTGPTDDPTVNPQMASLEDLTKSIANKINENIKTRETEPVAEAKPKAAKSKKKASKSKPKVAEAKPKGT
jgi:hypothetical protein